MINFYQKLPETLLEKMHRFFSEAPTGQYDDEVLWLIEFFRKQRDVDRKHGITK